MLSYEPSHGPARGSSATVLIACLSLVEAAGAQTALPDSTGASIGGQVLEQITVRAEQREVDLQQAPVAISAISASALDQSNITQLADLFRLSLQNSDKQLVTLRKELETVDAFLSLQRLRHADRLQTKMQVDPQALDKYVPPFALQTLVENAVKHGIDSSARGGVIVCLAQLQAGILLISVQSPGSLSSRTNSTGIGLTNLRERLHLIFGTAATLRLFSARPGEVTAEIIVPRKVKTGESSHS